MQDDAYQPCPQCGESAVAPVQFTWWGGLVGPKLLSQVSCTGCGHQYNGKTGKPNTAAIAVYLSIFAVLAVAVVMMMSSL